MTRAYHGLPPLMTGEERAAEARACGTQLNEWWVPTQEHLAAPSPDDPWNIDQAQALLRSLPPVQKRICKSLSLTRKNPPLINLPRWWRRCRCVLAFRDALTAELE